ncbi:MULTISPECIES: tRNA (guanosine(37)-N1)-methyltransferase TrmD [Prochlorococcus]|uniref:Multifunctional fusion protein n=1 Tax=Prochlorococcus marinus (strain SARG / CCMP1375 / SS120) TaxID=167539 RepID=Q7TV99_PROMA|nr:MULTISPECIES: tRNA (guanosine(37)-N1)-methyltransferase TrmD [Prochlorococcus]AAQ00398.1 tRNA-(guanine-N1)-methyltransferase fused to 2-C-methyl-D-erythritol 2,4-cyclodiphosphate synthase [Prochlorococcus marinus subsp. marinus str. CCMP1375]KGG14279.1 tRNA (guanine-N1)-methyltransferase [Prochlorococcus marinus str. LG]KGG22148.1 tRNA (guanine-N1)-methyltransferase [Prochlorococcus marinus str. SS2]KGG24534.1 tRNA (guanine-N1)-methyltransferase [Prochlorococcus marinus str. SS35]KGG33429.1
MTAYRLDVLSLAPDSFQSLNELGVIGRAFSTGIADLNLYNPRNFTKDSYHKVDDEPYGGGVGMVLKTEPFFEAFESIPALPKRRVLMMTPQGNKLTQNDLWRWAKEYEQLVFICGHYEGFDERIRTLADEEISLGDFILTGGELAAMTIINGVLRLLPGTIGSAESLVDESHADGLLEHPHYTRPEIFRGLNVPKVLLSGNHAAISTWRQEKREQRTKERRPDLYELWVAKEASNKTRIDLSGFTSVPFRIGNGYDIHRLVTDRPLIIGGVRLHHPEGLGLDGHSDADVLIHSLMDAMLGALSLGDIGKYFPPNDPQWKDANSLMLLEKVGCLIKEEGWKVVNIDSVVIAERPKLKPHIDAMRQNIADKLGIETSSVGVKATTNELLGAEGREEGISSHAVVLLEKT